MQPPVTHTGTPAREDDYRLRPAAEPKSWVTDQPISDFPADRMTSRLYTHNAERFGRRQPEPVETVEPEAEPALNPPPHWMMMIAGAAVAALMGALLGGFMHI